ncbi:Cell division protein FtsL [Candidatus Magnetobacterium bavaricum]|uniref:Cell division protein FtsL n=1 Tax=Candidatus Magnetobacterium bavaricum TaxID=29290 RepID=A0A0F3GUS9_9BACT|nr:Cell division protein FtsL [Candidatus Magnetobacterium bavaricum]
MIRTRRNEMLSNALMALGVLLIVAGIFSTVWLRSSIKSLQYRLGNLQQRQHQLIKEQRNLTARKENLLSIANIDQVAKKMGFDFPDRSRVIHVKEKG